MAGVSFTSVFRTGNTKGMGEGEQEAIDELIASLPQEKGPNLPPRCLYQNFWCPVSMLPNVVVLQKQFKARDNDVVLASYPKSGTTWLKAMAFSIVNRSHFDISNTPLLTSNPHELVPAFEYLRFDLDNMDEQRLFSTHLPYPSLPECIRESNCRIIYICRNPLDTVVSSWHFFMAMARAQNQPEWSLEEHCETFCEGKMGFGPFWDHIVGYWKESLERPDKVLFLKYEDLKDDVEGHLKKVAHFLGLPFSIQEEERGAIEEITKMCSFSTLSGLDVNKSGKKKSFFRKGEVGDWVNQMSLPMVHRLNNIMLEKLSPFGLQFKMC